MSIFLELKSQVPGRWVGEVALAFGRARSTVSLPFSQAPTRWSAGRAHYTLLRCRCRWRTVDGRASRKDASALALVWSAGFFMNLRVLFSRLRRQHPSPSTGLFVEVEVRKVLWIWGEYRVVPVVATEVGDSYKSGGRPLRPVLW